MVAVPKVAHVAEQQAVVLISVGLCALAVATFTAGLAVWHRRRVRARDDARVLALRQNALSPSEFEEALAALCRRDGCTDVKVVGGSGDLGADVIARTPDGRRIVLQAKRYRNGRTVGSQDVQRQHTGELSVAARCGGGRHADGTRCCNIVVDDPI
ncbi:restriction endonuclease [Nocardia sp. GCM10030253]|uniref:restriction endonuclease n=1 Tax=Nocardia sp. GCM10030253 TaxID=3273404 RepID=UPI00362FCBE8